MDNAHRISQLQRTIIIYEMALDVYDEFIAKGSLESGGDIRAMMSDPGHPEFAQEVERFVQDPASCTPTDVLPLATLPGRVQTNRTAASVRLRGLRTELDDLGVSNF